MIKFFGGLVVGVFVGALAVELLERGNPALVDKVREKARNLGDKLRSTPSYVDSVLRRQGSVPDGEY